MLADRHGRRRVFASGLVLFTACSALCGAAPSAVVLDLARGAQGIGAAAMFAASLALLAAEFQGRERGLALGVWGAITGGALAVGPLVGGLLVDGPGWRWIFSVNLPLGGVADLGDAVPAAGVATRRRAGSTAPASRPSPRPASSPPTP